MTIKLPIAKEEDTTEEDRWFVEFINKSKLSLSMQQTIQILLNDFYLNKNWLFKERIRWSSDNQEELWVLLSMRNMIEWLIRWDPIKVETWMDKKTNKLKYSDWYIHQNFWYEWESEPWEIENQVNSKSTFKLKDWDITKDIPIMGAYAQRLLAAIFPKPAFNWRRLQLWQQRFLLERWLHTIVLAPREWGKSLAASYIAFLHLMKQTTSYFDSVKWNNIHFFGLSEKQLDQVANYVVWMVRWMIENKKAIRFNKTDHEVILNDWGVDKKIQLISSQSLSKGRWERPTLIIIDEAWYTDQEVYEIAKGNAWVPIIMITTVNYKAKRNWAYDLYLQWLQEQRTYEPVEDLIKRIYFKYWLDKVTTKEQLNKMVEDDVFREMRSEFNKARQLVSLKFTIDDRENLTLDDKEWLIMSALRTWEKFLAAEHYSEYVEELTLLNPDWLFDNTMPKLYDVGYVWYDPAVRYDNAAIVMWWYKDWVLYIENSIILPSDPVEKIKKLRSVMLAFKQKCKRFRFVVDLTQAEAELTTLEDRWFDIDVPVMYTKWSWINYKWKFHLVGKKVLVNDVSKEMFFDRGIIRISSDLIWDWSLSEELQYFTLKQNGKYEASQWKDDQVNAMMLVCYACYDEIVRYNLNWERFLWYWPEEGQTWSIEEQEMEDIENERIGRWQQAIDMGLL